MNDYPDRHGIAFSRCREYLPKLARDFPEPLRVTDSRMRIGYRRCWERCQVCGRRPPEVARLETHHLVGGVQGRSDERANLLVLCAGGSDTCHERAKTSELPQEYLLFCKWREDQDGTDWVRLAILSRCFLPDLIESRPCPTIS